MFKSIMLVASCAAAAFAAGSVPRTIYSPQQLVLPIGHSIKTTPDPANIWSWSNTFTPGYSGISGSSQVVVDLDGDGQMDTMNPHVRVLITDAQVWANGGTEVAIIRDDSGDRWRLQAHASPGSSSGVLTGVSREVHFATPIVLPVGSQLWVDWGTSGAEFNIHLIGRVVNL